MKTEIVGITRANEGMQGISWNILGQTYVPKHCSEHSFSWHATFPPDTFVPPHIHPDQDEYLYILEGKLDFMLAGADTSATPGDLVRIARQTERDLSTLMTVGGGGAPRAPEQVKPGTPGPNRPHWLNALWLISL